MEILSYGKLEEINGGGKTLWIILGGIWTFLLGFFNGIVNPKKCNS